MVLGGAVRGGPIRDEFDTEISNQRWPGRELGEEHSGRGSSKMWACESSRRETVWLGLGRRPGWGQEGRGLSGPRNL